MRVGVHVSTWACCMCVLFVLPQALMTVGRIEKLFMNQQQWERGDVGIHCSDENERRTIFEKQQFVLQFFLGFLKIHPTSREQHFVPNIYAAPPLALCKGKVLHSGEHRRTFKNITVCHHSNGLIFWEVCIFVMLQVYSQEHTCQPPWFSCETPIFHCLLLVSSLGSQFSHKSPDLWCIFTLFLPFGHHSLFLFLCLL